MPTQVENGKAFEYAIAITYFEVLKSKGVYVRLIEDKPFLNAKRCFALQNEKEQNRFLNAAEQTVETLTILEPGLVSSKKENDVLVINIAPDVNGEMGDVRDVLFARNYSSPKWEIGFSAKNNHEAVKHSRLSPNIDFGFKWIGVPCSKQYFDDIHPVFESIREKIESNPNSKWSEIPDKEDSIYYPVLYAFKEEIFRMEESTENFAKKLLGYLIGQYPFYKIIKEDRNNTVVVKAFNLGNLLNKTVNGVKPSVKVEGIKYPTRIIELDFVKGSKTTLMMILDEGWQISFRIHNASTKLECSLKFDIQLIGNPPILFSQHLFNITPQ